MNKRDTLKLYKTEFFHKGIMKAVILAYGFEEAVGILCDKLRNELPPKEMSVEALPAALRNMKEVPLDEGVILFARDPLD
jgi:hypothetical protein